MCVCIYVYMNLFILCMYVRIYVYMCANVFLYVYTSMYVHSFGPTILGLAFLNPKTHEEDTFLFYYSK